MLPREAGIRPSVKKSKYFIRRPPKCKYCDKDVKRNEQPDGRNKGYYKTCGGSLCLSARFHDAAVNARKHPISVTRICEHCSSEFIIKGWSQRWCDVCVPNKIARGRMQRYGISAPDFANIVAGQGGLCALCRKDVPTDLDHNHETNKPRGALCSKCNTGMHFVDDIEWMGRAREYAISEWCSEEVL